MKRQVHGRFVGARSSNGSAGDSEEELPVPQYGDEQLFRTSSRQNVAIDRAFSTLCPPQRTVFEARVSDGSVLVSADSRNNDTDMNQCYLGFDTHTLFATQDSSESSAYEATPTYNTSDGTIEKALVLTPQSTNHAFSEIAALESNFEPQGSVIPDFFPGWNNGYGYSGQVDPRQLVLRSQTELPDLGSPISFVTPDPRNNDFDFSAFLSGEALEPIADTLGSQSMVGPWNSEAALNNRYRGPGYSTFLPSFAPVSSPRSSERVQRTQPGKVRRRIGQAKKVESQELQWEHSFLADGGSLQNRRESVEPTRENARGRRNGPLSPEQAKKAVEVRKKGACWRCWNMHVTCDTIEVCLKCQHKAQTAGLTRSCCYRQDLVDFGHLFFPTAMVSHLDSESIRSLVDEHISKFTTNTFRVAVTSGHSFKPMKLIVCQFSPRTDDLVHHHQTRIHSNGETRRSEMLYRNAAPLGLEPGIDIEDLKPICEAHIWSMVDNSSYAYQSTAGQTTKIPQMLLEIMQEYFYERPQEKNGLLHRAMGLHAMHHFMGRVISFTPESTHELLHYFGWQESSEFDFFSSRLLNRQIKYAMHDIHQKLNAAVLRDLHDEIRKKSPESWISSFGTIIILCLCAEELQVAVDGFTTFTIGQSGNSTRASQNGLNICRRLDETIEMFTDIFHDVYGTRKKTKKPKNGGFNPFLSDPGVCASMGYAAVAMVGRVREVIEANREEMQELKAPVFNEDIFPPREIDLAMRNPGRLLSQFLLPFLD